MSAGIDAPSTMSPSLKRSAPQNDHPRKKRRLSSAPPILATELDTPMQAATNIANICPISSATNNPEDNATNPSEISQTAPITSSSTPTQSATTTVPIPTPAAETAPNPDHSQIKHCRLHCHHKDCAVYDDNWLYLPTDAKFRGEFWLKKSLRDLEFEMCTCIKRGGHYHPLPRSIGGPKIPLDPDDLSPEELLKMLDFDHTLKIRIGLHDAQAYLENVISFRFYDHLISAFDGHVPPAYELVSELRQCIIPYITIAQFFGEWLDRLPGKRDFMSLETLKNKLQDSVFGYILRRDKYLTNREIDELNQDWRQRLLNACDLAIDDLIWLFALKHIRVGRRAKVQVDSEPEVPSGPVMKKREEGAKPLSSLCPVDNFSGQEDRGGKSSSEDGGPSVDNIVDDPPRGSNDKNSEKAPNKDDTEAAIKKRKRHAPSGPGEMKEEGSDVETLPPADHHFNGSHQGRGGTGNQKKTKGGDDTKVLTKKPKRKAPHPSKRKAADEEDDYFPSKAEERRAKRQRGRRA